MKKNEALPLVSIPVLTYNGEKFLRKQLDSIFSQTYKNIEVLAYDDASSDDTVKILKEYEKQHSNFKVFVNTKNVGINQNFVNALKECNGDYISPADQDDIWYDEKVEFLVNNIGDNILIQSSTTVIDEDDNKLYQKSIEKFNAFVAHQIMFKSDIKKFILSDSDKWCKISMNYDEFIAKVFFYFKLQPIKLMKDVSLVYRRHHQTQLTALNKDRSYLKPLKKFNKRIHRRKVKINAEAELSEYFLSLKDISQETKSILKVLAPLQRKSLRCFHNKELYKFFIKHHNFFYGDLEKDVYTKIAKKRSRGFWFYAFRV